MYVPPQMYDRFQAINEICKDKRDNNYNLKTQLRYGTNDFEILTKEKGTTEPFRIAEMKDFIGDSRLPDFNHNIKWRRQSERPGIRRITNRRSSSPNPAARENYWRKTSHPQPVEKTEPEGQT